MQTCGCHRCCPAAADLALLLNRIVNLYMSLIMRARSSMNRPQPKSLVPMKHLRLGCSKNQRSFWRGEILGRRCSLVQSRES